MSTPIHYGDLLAAARTRAGLSQQDVADRLGVTRAAVSGVECSEHVNTRTLARFAEALGCTVPDLVAQALPPADGGAA